MLEKFGANALKESPLALGKKKGIIIKNILSDKVHARYKVLSNDRYTS